jgi:endo-1,4-beta-xylanase
MTQPSHSCTSTFAPVVVGPPLRARPLERLFAGRALAVWAAAAIGWAGCILPPEAPPTAPAGGKRLADAEVRPLREAAAPTKRHIGCALQPAQLHDDAFRKVAAAQFDSLTPENQMKWETVEPQPGQFAFQAAEPLVTFAAEHQMRVRGHTLIWHSQLAPWVKSRSGEALHAAMISHIQAVVGHWKGRVAQWDVVNEALADGPSGRLRADSPFSGLGPTFIDDAFLAAHQADPDAQLFYNDYDIEGAGTPKSDAAFALVRRLTQAGIPVHGVGLQMHVGPRHWPAAPRIRANMERLASLGVLVELTEMDVAVGEIAGTIDQKLDRQRVITHEIVAACLAVEACSGITFWGLSDRYSWLNSPRWGALRGQLPHYPLPFDSDYRAKPMVAGILDALAGR